RRRRPALRPRADVVPWRPPAGMSWGARRSHRSTGLDVGFCRRVPRRCGSTPLSSRLAAVMAAIEAPLPANVPVRSIVIDFDGTICPADVSDHILLEFVGPIAREPDPEYERGDIASRETLV